MARISNADLLARYKSRISSSRKWRKDEGYDETWRRLIDLYRGQHYEHFTEEDRLLINISFSTINVIAPSVAVNYPKITVNANLPENAPQAIITEAVINYWWKHYDVTSEFRTAIKDYLMIGHGWVKTGYRFIEENAEDTEDDNSDPNAEGNEVTPITKVVKDQPFAERVSPFDVFVDPDATSMRDIRWIAQRIRRPIAEVKSDKRYAKAAREMVTATAWAKYSDDPSRRKVQDQSQGYVDVWEYYDLHSNSISVFSETCEQFLIKPTAMPYAFGQPFTMIRNYDVPDSFYPMGDLEAIEPLQHELNETRTQMMNHRKKFSRKYLFRESAFDGSGRDALASDDDNVLVPVVSDEPLGGVVAPFPAVINPPEFYNQTDLIISDIDRVSGVSEYQRGGTPEIRRTATEASILMDAANVRTADKLATVEKAIGFIAKRLIQLAQQFMTGEQVARVVGKDGVPMWVKFDRDYIAGDFDFEVVGGSTQPINESARRQMALQMVDAMAPFASMGVIDMRALAGHVLQYGFGVKTPERFMVPEAPEEQTQDMGPEAPMESTEQVPMQMPPQGGEAPMPSVNDIPPELLAQLLGGQGQPAPMAPAPVMPPAGMTDQFAGLPPELGGGLPPELAMLPPEVLDALLQQTGGDLSLIPPDELAMILQQFGGGMPPQGGMPPL